MRSVWLVGLLLLPALSGCLGQRGPADASPEPPADVARTLTMGGCVDQTGRFPAPIDELRAELPAPFEPVPLDPAGLYGERWILAGRCGPIEGDGVSVPEATFFLAGILVSAPDDHRQEAGTLVVATDIAAGPELAGLFARWGQGDARLADVQYDFMEGVVGIGRATIDGISFDVTGGTPENVIGADFFRFFLLDDGALNGAIDWHTTEGLARRGSATLSDGRQGRGGLFWGDGYAYNLTHVPLERITVAPPIVEPPRPAGLAEPIHLEFNGHVGLPYYCFDPGVPSGNPVEDAFYEESSEEFVFDVPVGTRFINGTLDWDTTAPEADDLDIDIYRGDWDEYRGGAYANHPETFSIELEVGDEGPWLAWVYNCQNPPTDFTLEIVLS